MFENVFKFGKVKQSLETTKNYAAGMGGELM